MKPAVSELRDRLEVGISPAFRRDAEALRLIERRATFCEAVVGDSDFWICCERSPELTFEIASRLWMCKNIEFIELLA